LGDILSEIGYQASHEQFAPGELLKYVQMAEQAGFQAVLSSDHIHPWSEQQGHSGFALSWLGAAMQATRLPFGIVTVPGYRYHPAVLAQAVATLEEMFPGRFFLTMGSGEALNEHITGGKWPVKAERNEILCESAEVMRRLWQGEEVTHYGRVTVEQAKVYIQLPRVPQIIGAALSEPTARWLGGWADGLITTARPVEELKKMVEAFHAGGGEGKRLILKADISYDHSYEQALQGAYEQWRSTLLSSEAVGEIKTTALFDSLSEGVSMDTVKEGVMISDDPAVFVDWLHELSALGFEKIILHNVNRKQEPFIETFGQQVLPRLKGK
jgi:coenzyme F420-dependent glucose-6-phosphate dehydrogenase